MSTPGNHIIIVPAARLIRQEIIDIANRTLKELEKAYKQDKNQIYVWKAWKICNQLNMPLPDWVRRGLNDIANEILQEAEGYRAPKRSTRTEINQYRKWQKGLSIIEQVEQCRLDYYQRMGKWRGALSVCLQEIGDKRGRSFRDMERIWSKRNK